MKTSITIECDSPGQAERLLKYGTSRTPNEVMKRFDEVLYRNIASCVQDLVKTVLGLDPHFGRVAVSDFSDGLKDAIAKAEAETIEYIEKPVPEGEMY
jgi:hypothetical protein